MQKINWKDNCSKKAIIEQQQEHKELSIIIDSNNYNRIPYKMETTIFSKM